jgi:hypothetical protein
MPDAACFIVQPSRGVDMAHREQRPPRRQKDTHLLALIRWSSSSPGYSLSFARIPPRALVIVDKSAEAGSTQWLSAGAFIGTVLEDVVYEHAS